MGVALQLKVRRLRPTAALPKYMTDASAGLDLSSDAEAPIQLLPGQRAVVPTGLTIELPPGYEGQVRPRSGLAVRQGLTVVNAPGTIDQDYRGEIAVALINLGQEPVLISPGMRIAQLVIAPVARVAIAEVEELTETARAGGGFGHTGT